MVKPFSNNLGYWCSESSYRVALPHEDAAVFDNFGANEKERWFWQKGRASEYLSAPKPEQVYFLAVSVR